MNRRSPWAASATQGERIERQLLRGSERDLELEGDTRHRVERVVPSLGWDARVAEKIRNVGLAVYHVAVDVENLRARRPKVRIVRPRRHEMGARDVHVRVLRAKGAGAAEAVAAARHLLIARDRPIGEAVELDPAPEAAKLGAARLRVLAERRGRVVAVAGNADLPRIVAGTAAVGTRRRGKPRRQRRRSGKRRHHQNRTSHKSPSVEWSALPSWPCQSRAKSRPFASGGHP